MNYAKLERVLGSIEKALNEGIIEKSWYENLAVKKEDDGKYTTRLSRINKFDATEDNIIEQLLGALSNSYSYHVRDIDKYDSFDEAQKKECDAYIALFNDIYFEAYNKRPDAKAYEFFRVVVPNANLKEEEKKNNSQPARDGSDIVYRGTVSPTGSQDHDSIMAAIIKDLEREHSVKVDEDFYNNYDIGYDGVNGPEETMSFNYYVSKKVNEKANNEEKPEENTPVDEEQKKGTPDEETPDKKTPDGETPDKKTPVEETPDKKTPDKEPNNETPNENGGTDTPKDETGDLDDVVVKTTPWQWVKDHKKQILIVLGLAAMAVSLYLVVTHLMPALIAANNAQMVSNSLAVMSKNAAQWHGAAPAIKAALHSSSEALAANVTSMTGLQTAFTNATGVWTIGGQSLGAATTAAAEAATKTAALVKGFTGASLATGLGGIGALGVGLLSKNKSNMYKKLVAKIGALRTKMGSMTKDEFKAVAKEILQEIESPELSTSEKKELQHKLNNVIKKKQKMLNKQSNMVQEMVDETMEAAEEEKGKGK